MQLTNVSYKNLKITFNIYIVGINIQITFNKFTFTPYCDVKNTNGQANSQVENKLKMTQLKPKERQREKHHKHNTGN